MAFNLAPLDTYLTSLTVSRTGDSSPLDIIEIEGHPGSGKTHLFYLFLSSCITPGHYPSSSIDSGVKTAVLFDMDAQFDICRFRDIMIARIRYDFGPTAQSTDIADRCLENLHIFKPTTTDQLLATLAHLPKLRCDRFAHSGLAVVAIHSVEALYWSDRFKVESRTRTTSFPGRNPVYQKVYSYLRSIQETCGTRVVLSHSGLNQVPQHYIPQHTGNQEAQYLDDHATINGVSSSSTLFLTVKRVLREPDIASQSSGDYFRVSGQVSRQQELIHFDVQITQNEGLVVVREEE